MNYSLKNRALALIAYCCTLSSSVLSVDREELNDGVTIKAKNAAPAMKRPYDEIESTPSFQKQARRILSMAVGNENSELCESIDKESIQHLIVAANLGNAEAQYNLGNIYSEGKEVQKNEAKAVKWWKMSANQEYAKAQCNLGASYARGRGVVKNKFKAAQLCGLAANQGIPEAQYNLGNMYAKGKGVKKNEIEAVKLFILGAQKNFGPARNRLARYYEKGFFVYKGELIKVNK